MHKSVYTPLGGKGIQKTVGASDPLTVAYKKAYLAATAYNRNTIRFRLDEGGEAEVC